MNVWVIALNTFREAIRNRILYVALCFAVFLIVGSALFASVTIGDQSQVIRDFGLFAISAAGSILTMLLGVSLLHREQKQKTIYNILSKPVSRWQFLLGKHLGLSLTAAVLVAAMGFGLVGFLVFIDHRVDWLLFQGIAFAMLESTVIAAVVIFFSSLAVTTTLPGVLTFATYIAGHSIRSLAFFVDQSSHPSSAARALVTFFSWALPDLSLFNTNEILVYGGSLTFQQTSFATMYCLGYSMVALVIASLIYARRELN